MITTEEKKRIAERMQVSRGPSWQTAKTVLRNTVLREKMR